MSEIDLWVFNNVIDWLLEHQADHVIPRLLVNLSGLSFSDDDFSSHIVERLSRGDVDPSYIAFEISERAAVKNFAKVSQFIDRIRALGCELALDDFGSGFSSFSYLKQLSFDYIKIDGSLVNNIATNEVDHDMVAAINQIGHTIGAKTIAEFVEDDASLNCLREMQVDYAQGYGLRMPSPLEQLSEELEKRLPGESGHVVEQWIKDSDDKDSESTAQLSENDRDVTNRSETDTDQTHSGQTVIDPDQELPPLKKAS